MKIIVLFSMLLLVGFGLGQELSSRQKSDLRTATQRLDAVEKKLNDFAGLEGPYLLAKFEREQSSLQRGLASAQENLSALPSDHPEVAPLLQRYQTLSQQFADLPSKMQNSATAKGNWEEYLNSGYKADAEVMEGLLEVIKNGPEFFNLNSPSHSFYREPSNDRGIQMAKGYANIAKTLDGFIAKFQGFGEPARNSKLKAENLKREMGRVDSAVTAFKSGAMANVTQRINTLKAKLDGQIAQKDYAGLTDYGGTVSAQRRAMAHIALMYKALDPAGAAPIEAEVNKLEALVNSAIEKVANEIIQSNRAPVDRYTAGDASALKTAVQQGWKQDYPRDQILSVRLVESQWRREAGWRWEDGRSAWVKFDDSFLLANVMVKFSDKHVAMFVALIRKNHLSANALTLWMDRYEKPAPNLLMLLSNYK